MRYRIKRLGRYLRDRGSVLGFSLLVCLVNFTVFTLYHLPVFAVAYAASISLFCGAVSLAVGYVRFCRHQEQLACLKEETVFSLESLPEPSGPLEEEYQRILEKVCAERDRLEQKLEARYQEMIDYYTVWVHQIKTPISAMRLILQGKGEGDRQELGEELNRIEQYVEMVLCYLRLDADSTDYVFRESDLDELLRPVIRRHASVFIRKRLRLEYEPLCVRTVTDEKWLTFVVDQILTNALKYTASGTISITLEEPKTLCIADTGIGIAAEDLPRIFERGYTGGNGRRDQKASGIGLYLCRRICENLGHVLSVESEPGRGTCVRIGLQNAGLMVE